MALSSFVQTRALTVGPEIERLADSLASIEASKNAISGNVSEEWESK
jgi:hypothetical protein